MKGNVQCRVWDLDKGTCKGTMKAGAEGKVALSSDGRVLSSLTANDIRTWSLGDLAQACNATPVAVAQSTDGELVKVMRSNDLQVLGSLVLTQQVILSTLSIINDRIAVFAADGRLLVYQLSILGVTFRVETLVLYMRSHGHTGRDVHGVHLAAVSLSFLFNANHPWRYPSSQYAARTWRIAADCILVEHATKA
ncbi:hypothetical protein HaLaN_08216 [Haematococcus lacustris]|uniref:WD_REPEATS_REGION domain-containing protein n=1 Tax=Haematococcus lacustris TaxID=44745 RepID=A0A699ZAL5_HAELA|nr:hypothetical protein HaLaN_08216 [Haematococcus lacustris]